MIFVREVPLSQNAIRALKGVIGAAKGGGLLARLSHSGRPASQSDKDRAERAALADAVLRRGVCEEVEVWHDALPAIAEHAGGLYVFVQMHARATLLLDLRPIAEDPRWALHQAGAFLTTHWRWLRFPGLRGPWCFLAEGHDVLPVKLGSFHGTELEIYMTEDIPRPGDDTLLPISFDEIERLARRRLYPVAASAAGGTAVGR
jgi:hypothetical protein